jgi:rhodanese-related sulfurtransferase
VGIALVLAGLAAWAGPPPVGAGHAPALAFPTLRSDALKRLLDAGETVVLVDLRKPGEYRGGHLPGAISVPLAELGSRHRAIPTRGRVVLYCDCPAEDLASAYRFLWTLGYRNHVGLEDGFAGWYGRQYPVAR